jgi:hypothetical protein
VARSPNVDQLKESIEQVGLLNPICERNLMNRLAHGFYGGASWQARAL